MFIAKTCAKLTAGTFTHTHRRRTASASGVQERHLNVKVFDAVDEPAILLAKLPVPLVAVALAICGDKEHLGDDDRVVIHIQYDIGGAG